MSKPEGSEEAAATYQQVLFSHVPMYTTRLVRETHFTFPHREQVSSGAIKSVSFLQMT